MNLLTPSKATLLLNAGLEVLHEQSREWLSEIAFWKDEAAFFYSLMVKKTLDFVPLDSEKEISHIEKELISITADDLNELQKSVERHESFLTDLLEYVNKDPKNYREEHEKITNQITAFEQRFKTLKKEVFAFVENIDKK